jgi:8-oxo-dGTP pyrophosphatase MutT (NUDIX family)
MWWRRYRRRTARVLLVDGADRLLLLANLDPVEAPDGHVWLTPGGGVERREALNVAAARELAEEVGLRVSPDELGAPVAYTSGYADLGWSRGVFRDDFFFHRVAGHEVDTSGFTQLELETVVGHRWWTLTDLAAADHDVAYPLGLVDLVGRLLAGWRPAIPEQLPWHH